MMQRFGLGRFAAFAVPLLLFPVSGYQAYQSQELWPVARSLIIDHWITKEPTAIEAWAWKSGKWAAS